jgi:hypothetical protein
MGFIGAGIGAGVGAGVGAGIGAGAAAGIAAAGSVAAAGISAGVQAGTAPKGMKARTASQGLQTSTSLELAAFGNNLEQGLVNVNAIGQTSPLAQTMANMMSSGALAIDNRERFGENIIAEYNRYKQWVEAGRNPATRPTHHNDFLDDQLFQFSGYENLTDMWEAQLQWEPQADAMIARSQEVASGNFDRRLNAFEGINALSASGVDASAANIDAITAAQKQRFLRDVNFQAKEASDEASGAANFGNFNPGDQLAEISRIQGNAVQDADLEAMRRAMAMIGGLQGIQQQGMSFLRSQIDPATIQGTAIGGVELNSQGNTIDPGTQAPPNNIGQTIGAGIGNAASIFADGLRDASDSRADANLLNRLGF